MTFIDGFALPHNGFEPNEEGVRALARLVRRVHDLQLRVAASTLWEAAWADIGIPGR